MPKRNVLIRDITEDDLPSVAKIVNDCERSKLRSSGHIVTAQMRKKGERESLEHLRQIFALHVHQSSLVSSMVGVFNRKRLDGYAAFGRTLKNASWGAKIIGQARGELGHLYVRPSAQGHGIGATLFQTAKESFQASDLRKMFLHTEIDNEIAAAFYERLGGQTDGKIVDHIPDDGTPLIEYLWDLRQ